MHIEVLVEDSSGATLIETLLPGVIGPPGKPHTWRVHAYKGIGRLPKTLALPLSRKNRWTFLSPSSTVRNGTTTPDQAHVIDS